MLTLDEAYRAVFRFTHQYYKREPMVPFQLLLHSMTELTPGAHDARSTADPANWDDWMTSVEAAQSSTELPAISPFAGSYQLAFRMSAAVSVPTPPRAEHFESTFSVCVGVRFRVSKAV